MLKMEIRFSAERLAEVKQIIERYPEGRQKSALLPVLHIAQAEFDNWLSPEVMDYVAELLEIEPIEVYEVASFYTMFNLQPVGKYVLETCRTGPCCLVGAEKLQAHLEEKLGIKPGETTADGLFTLKPVECLAACGFGPVMQVGAAYYERLTPEKLDELLDRFRNENQRATYC
ncbi:MAG TPA: NAD(P)H-dependent oxidoreductase subunit E [Anseongella sp.]